MDTPRVGDNSGIRSLLAVLARFEDQCAVVPSPLVASRLQRDCGGSLTAVAAAAASLTRAQLLGDEPLPEVIPSFRNLLEEVSLVAHTPAEQRVLLHAALDVTEDLSVILEASGVDSGVLVRGGLKPLLSVRDHQAWPLDERMRRFILQGYASNERASANRALARSAKRAGLHSAACLYASRVKGAMRRPDLAGEVLREAARQLRRGFSHNAYVLARGVASSDSSLVFHAQRAMGHAAFWNGNLGAARAAFVAIGEEKALSTADAEVLKVIDWLRSEPDVRHSLLDVVVRLRDIAATERDAVLLADVVRAAELSAAGEHGAFDTLTTQIGLSMYRRRRGGANAWDGGRSSTVTPVVGAVLRMIDVGVCMRVGDWEQAAQMLESSVRVAPLGALPIGIVSQRMSLLAASGRAEWRRLAEYFGGLDQPGMASTLVPPPGAGLVALVNGYLPQRSNDQPEIPTVTGSSADRSVLPPKTPEWSPLSRRQTDVYRLLLQGCTNLEIASSLGIAERTVEAHLAQVYRKIGVRSRGELIARELANLRSAT